MPTYQELVEQAGKYITAMISDHAKADIRSSYHRFLGKYTTSQKDVIKKCTANLKLLNQVSQMLYQKDVVTFEDETAELPNITINQP